ncbi:MAG: lipase family protein [Hyphomicrobiales bacterium]
MHRFIRTRIISLIAALSLLLASMPAPAFAQAAPPQIDWELLYRAAQLANLSYDGTSAIMGEAMARQSKVFVNTPGNTDVQYFIGYNDKKKVQLIAVRGTDNDANWELDKDTRGVTDPKTGIMLHAGFKRAADAIYADVKPRLKKGYTTYLTGHSLGGAVAAILGIYLTADKWPVAGIITFGQPKFTNLAGVQAYANLPLIRVINQSDMVPLLPDEAAQGGSEFAHLGAVVIVFPGPYYVYGAADRATKFSSGSFGRYFTQGSVPDHYLKWYEENLRSKLSGAVPVKFADREKYIVRHGPNDGPTSGLKASEKRQNFGGSR